MLSAPGVLRDAVTLELEADAADAAGRAIDAVRLMERALLLRLQASPPDDLPECCRAAERLVVRCNTIAVRFFRGDDYAAACDYLDNAMRLTEPDAEPLRRCGQKRKTLRGTTLNNYACLEKRRGRLTAALSYIQLSVENSHQSSPATYLNLSAILTQMGRSADAASAARRAIALLEAGATRAEDVAEAMDGFGDASRAAQGQSLSTATDYRNTIAIAYHNLATALEAVDLVECISVFEEGYRLALATVGGEAAVTKSIATQLMRLKGSLPVIAMRAGESSAATAMPSARTAAMTGAAAHAASSTVMNSATATAPMMRAAAGSAPSAASLMAAEQSAFGHSSIKQRSGLLPPMQGLSAAQASARAASQSARLSAFSGSAQSQGLRQPLRPGRVPPLAGGGFGGLNRVSAVSKNTLFQGTKVPSSARALPSSGIRHTIGTTAPLSNRTGDERLARPTVPTAPGRGRVNSAGRPGGRAQSEDLTMQEENMPFTELAADDKPLGQEGSSAPRKGGARTRAGSAGATVHRPHPPPAARTAASTAQQKQQQAAQEAAARRQSQVQQQQQQLNTAKSSYGLTTFGVGGNFNAMLNGIINKRDKDAIATSADILQFMSTRLESMLINEIRFESEYQAATKIQCLIRCFFACRRADERRALRLHQLKKREERERAAAAVLQRALSALVRRRRARNAAAQRRRMLEALRRHAAVLIQRQARIWLARAEARRRRVFQRSHAAALVKLQCWFRCLTARRLTEHMRRVRDEKTREDLQAQRRWHATLTIQRTWRGALSAVATRRASGERRAELERQHRRRRESMAGRIQRAWRGYRARRRVAVIRARWAAREALRQRAAQETAAVCRLQALYRGNASRKVTLPLLEAERERRAGEYVRHRAEAATAIQRVVRGHQARIRAARLVYVRRLVLMRTSLDGHVRLLQRIGVGYGLRRYLGLVRAGDIAYYMRVERDKKRAEEAERAYWERCKKEREEVMAAGRRAFVADVESRLAHLSEDCLAAMRTLNEQLRAVGRQVAAAVKERDLKRAEAFAMMKATLIQHEANHRAGLLGKQIAERDEIIIALTREHESLLRAARALAEEAEEMSRIKLEVRAAARDERSRVAAVAASVAAANRPPRPIVGAKAASATLKLLLCEDGSPEGDPEAAAAAEATALKLQGDRIYAKYQPPKRPPSDETVQPYEFDYDRFQRKEAVRRKSATMIQALWRGCRTRAFTNELRALVAQYQETRVERDNDDDRRQHEPPALTDRAQLRQYYEELERARKEIGEDVIAECRARVAAELEQEAAIIAARDAAAAAAYAAMRESAAFTIQSLRHIKAARDELRERRRARDEKARLMAPVIEATHAMQQDEVLLVVSRYSQSALARQARARIAFSRIKAFTDIMDARFQLWRRREAKRRDVLALAAQAFVQEDRWLSAEALQRWWRIMAARAELARRRARRKAYVAMLERAAEEQEASMQASIEQGEKSAEEQRSQLMSAEAGEREGLITAEHGRRVRLEAEQRLDMEVTVNEARERAEHMAAQKTVEERAAAEQAAAEEVLWAAARARQEALAEERRRQAAESYERTVLSSRSEQRLRAAIAENEVATAAAERAVVAMTESEARAAVIAEAAVWAERRDVAARAIQRAVRVSQAKAKRISLREEAARRWAARAEAAAAEESTGSEDNESANDEHALEKPSTAVMRAAAEGDWESVNMMHAHDDDHSHEMNIGDTTEEEEEY